MAEVVEFAHAMQADIIVLLVVRHFADIVFFPKEQAFLVEHDPICVNICWFDVIYGRSFFVVLDIVGRHTFSL